MTATISPLRKPAKSVAPPVWLSPEQVCERVPGITVRNLSEMRDRGRGPRYFKPTPKTVIYEQGVIDQWVADSAIDTRTS